MVFAELALVHSSHERDSNPQPRDCSPAPYRTAISDVLDAFDQLYFSALPRAGEHVISR